MLVACQAGGAGDPRVDTNGPDEWTKTDGTVGWNKPANAPFDRTAALAVVGRAGLLGLLDGQPDPGWTLDVEAYVEVPDCGSQRTDVASPRIAVAAYHSGQTESFSGGPHHAGDYSLQIVPSRFERCPLVLLVRDEGGNSRNYSYVLYRLDPRAGLQELWSRESDHWTRSTAHCYELSALDFSGLQSGAKNEIVVSTTAGCRRLFEGVGITKADLIPRSTRAVYAWSATQDRFVEVK